MPETLSLCFVIALMYILVAMTRIHDMPMCGYCGRRREHARDCKLREKD